MKKKVLIVEDDPVIVVSLEFLMTQNGFDVLLAKNGEEALEFANSANPDLILMDVMLPNKSGLEVCQELKTQPKYANTKIILVSAKGRGIDIDKGLALGADTYVTKPFSTRELVRKVRELLGEQIDAS